MGKTTKQRAPRSSPSPSMTGGPSGWFGGRGALLFALVLFPIIGLFIYVGPAWPGVLDHLATDGGLTLLWLAAAFGFGAIAWRLGGFENWVGSALRTDSSDSTVTVRGADPTRVTEFNLLSLFTTLALGLGILSLAVLGLGLIGVLNAFSAWALLAVGCALALAAAWPSLRRADGRMVSDWLAAPVGWGWLGLIATPFLAQALAGTMTPPGMLWTPNEPHGYDVVEYHLQVPREWFELGRIVPLHHNVFSFFPFNVEMHYLLAMHLCGGPWAGMYLAQMMHLAFMALAVFAVYAIVSSKSSCAICVGSAPRTASRWRETTVRGADPTKCDAPNHARSFSISLTPAPGLPFAAATSFREGQAGSRSRATAIIATLALLTVPWITQLAAIAYDEGGFLLFGTLAIGWAFSAARQSQCTLRQFALAGVMAGFAAGSKLTAVPEVLSAIPIVAFFGMFVSRPRVARGPLFAGLALFCLCGIVSFSPWLVRNVVWSGNPVFPELMAPLGHGGFDAGQVQRWDRAHHPAPAQQPVVERIKTFGREVVCGWQFGYLIIPLGLIGLALSADRPMGFRLAGMLVILTLFWLFFTHLQGRFFILAAPILALLIGQIEWRRFAIVGACLVTVFAAVAWWGINDRLCLTLYGSRADNRPGLVQPAGQFQPIGSEDLSWLMPLEIEAGKLPADVIVFLVGDARAFDYPIPMSQLRYRTVFDVPVRPGLGLLQAYTGLETIRHNDWLVVDPQELRRFAATYKPFPPVPPALEKEGRRYVEKY